MIVFLPHCGFLSEVSRALAIAEALTARGASVAFAARGGPYAHLIPAAGHRLHPLAPEADEAGARVFLDALLEMGRSDPPFFDDGELRAAVDAEVSFLRAVKARMVVTGFTLSAYLSSQIAGVPLATDHGGSFVPPVLSRGLCPAPVNPPQPGMARLPQWAQRKLANTAPALLRRPVAQLNQQARALGLKPLPAMLSLMCGDLTLITELPEALGLSAEALERWRPSWPYRVRPGATFRATGPLFARLDLPIPPQVSAFLAGGRGEDPVVYVSPTSVSESLLRALILAAKASGARVLASTTVHAVDDLSDARTMLAPVLPNHLIMPQVSAAVIMGGQGSVQTAMASGTPFVGLPWHGEQELNIAVAERRGMAVRLAPDAATRGAVTEALRRILQTPAFREAAEGAARLYAGVNGAARAADAILGWLDARQATPAQVGAGR